MVGWLGGLSGGTGDVVIGKGSVPVGLISVSSLGDE